MRYCNSIYCTLLDRAFCCDVVKRRAEQTERKSMQREAWKYNKIDSQPMQQWHQKTTFIFSVFMLTTYCTGPSHPQSQTWWSPRSRPPGWRCPSLRRRGLPRLRCSPSAPQPGGTFLWSAERRRGKKGRGKIFNHKLLMQRGERKRHSRIKITLVNSLQLDLCSQDENQHKNTNWGWETKNTQETALLGLECGIISMSGVPSWVCACVRLFWCLWASDKKTSGHWRD